MCEAVSFRVSLLFQCLLTADSFLGHTHPVFLYQKQRKVNMQSVSNLATFLLGKVKNDQPLYLICVETNTFYQHVKARPQFLSLLEPSPVSKNSGGQSHLVAPRSSRLQLQWIGPYVVCFVCFFPNFVFILLEFCFLTFIDNFAITECVHHCVFLIFCIDSGPHVVFAHIYVSSWQYVDYAIPWCIKVSQKLLMVSKEFCSFECLNCCWSICEAH